MLWHCGHEGEVVTTSKRNPHWFCLGILEWRVFVCFVFFYVSVVNLCLIYTLGTRKWLEHFLSSCDLPSEVAIFCSSVGGFPSDCHLSCCFRAAGCPQLSSHHFEDLAEVFNRVHTAIFRPMVMLVSTCLLFHRCLTYYLT